MADVHACVAGGKDDLRAFAPVGNGSRAGDIAFEGVGFSVVGGQFQTSVSPQVERAVLLLLVEPFQRDRGAVLQTQAAAPQMEQHVFAQIVVRTPNQVAVVQFQGAGAGDACVERQV